MDLRLPDMDGAEATRKLSAHERTAPIPVVAMSASPLEGSEDWLEEVGFAGWLEKPIHVSTFPEQVRGYCLGGKG
jgi:two-component system cell cycle response regulator DivK